MQPVVTYGVANPLGVFRCARAHRIEESVWIAVPANTLGVHAAHATVPGGRLAAIYRTYPALSLGQQFEVTVAAQPAVVHLAVGEAAGTGAVLASLYDADTIWWVSQDGGSTGARRRAVDAIRAARDFVGEVRAAVGAGLGPGSLAHVHS